MKLQFTPTEIRSLACKAGVFTNITDTTKRVLEVLASEGHDPISRRDVVAIIIAMEGSTWTTENNPGYEDLNAVVKALPRAEGRGYYTQGAKVGAQTLTERVVEMAAAGDIRIASKSGIRFKTAVFADVVDEDAIGYYAEDAGLRRIAATQTRCFGYFSETAKACKNCPLAAFCSEARMSKLAEIATRLDEATEAELKAALEPEEVATTETAETTEAKVADVGDEITLPFEGVCSACSQLMPEGSVGVYVDGAGLHHVGCVKEA